MRTPFRQSVRRARGRHRLRATVLAAIVALLAACLVQLTVAGPAQAASGSCPVVDQDPATVEASKALDLACKMVHDRITYSFGGGWGTHPGASYGHTDHTEYAWNDANVKGYDCSGFMHWLWYAVTGDENYLTLEGGANGQFHTDTNVAIHFTADQGLSPLRPGDMVFWGNPVHHVAMYLGGGLVVQESQSGTPANVAPFDHNGYVGAIRMYGFSTQGHPAQVDQAAAAADAHVAQAQAVHGEDGCGASGLTGCSRGCSALWMHDHPGDPLCTGDTGGGGGGGGGSGGGGSGSDGQYWVTTFSAAPGRDHGGTLNAGTNYVFCKVWGAQVGSGSAYNHWWLNTDMDTGGQDYVSAYYLSGQGNDQADDMYGGAIPECSSGGSGGGGTSDGEYWVDTFANAPARDGAGTLYAGTNYVLCKEWGAKVGSNSSYNHWWMFTDLDTGGQGWVSAYYLSHWGNDEAKDNTGHDIPACGSDGQYWVTTFSAAPGRDHGGTLNAGTNYVFCKVWGAQVGSGSAYNHWWLNTDMDTGGQDYVSAYYLSGQGNDQADDMYGGAIPTC